MQPINNLPPGFIPVEDAIALIKRDTIEQPTVDLQFLANNIPYMKAKQTYNIRLMKADSNGRAVRNGSVYVILQTEYDRQILLKAIQDAFETRTKIKLNVENIGLKQVTTMVDEAKGGQALPRYNGGSEVKAGTDISKPYAQTLQGV